MERMEPKGTGRSRVGQRTSAGIQCQKSGRRVTGRSRMQINQFTGKREIYIVVGFMKEKYEYLIDEYGVGLVVNADYAAKNNLHSIKLVKEHLENAYIIPSIIIPLQRIAQNPYLNQLIDISDINTAILV